MLVSHGAVLLAARSVEYRPPIEMHEHKLTVLYRKALRQQVMPHLHDSLQQAGVRAMVIEGGAGGLSRERVLLNAKWVNSAVCVAQYGNQ